MFLFFFLGGEEEKVELFKLLQLSNTHEVCKEKLLYYSSQQMRGPAVPSDKLAPRVSTASGNEALMFHITDVQQTLQEPAIFFQSLSFSQCQLEILVPCI